MNYYDRPEVSNSNLKELKRMYYADTPRDMSAVFAFGSLVDAMLTEPDCVDFYRLTLTDDRGYEIQFSPENFMLASKLCRELREHPIVSKLMQFGMKSQYVFIRTIEFVYEGTTYSIKGRCKFDGLIKSISTGIEYKTTSCTTQAAFVDSITHFDYDQAAAWYMDLARIDRLWIIGISKKNAQVFLFAVERGDETYTRGLRKYSLWAFRYITFIQDFITKIS